MASGDMVTMMMALQNAPCVQTVPLASLLSLILDPHSALCREVSISIS